MNITQKLTLLTAVTTALTLTGCNTMPQRSAGDTFRAAVKKSFEKDRNYNFTMKQQITLTPTSKKKTIAVEDAGYKALKDGADKSVKTMDDCDKAFDEALADKGRSDAAMEKAEDEYMACLKAASKQKGNKGAANPFDLKGNELEGIREVMTPERINAINEYWLKPMTVELNGAVDADSKRVLMDYRFAYKPQNFTLAVNFPMMLDFNDMSISLDPALALPFLGPVFDKDIGTSWNGKWVKFTLPDEFKKEIPTEIILSSLMTALQLSYDGIDDKFLSYAEKDALARQLGARNAVTLKMPPKQQILLLDRLLTNWVNELDKEATANPDVISNPKQFNQFLGMAKEMTNKGLLNNGEFKELMENEDFLSLMGETDYTFFLNGSNRMVGMLNTQKMTALADLINADINSRTVMTITNHNRADFSLVPSKSNIIDGNALIEKFAKGDIDNPFDTKSKPSYKFDNDADTASAAYGVDEGPAEAAATAVVEAAMDASAVEDIATADAAVEVLDSETTAPSALMMDGEKETVPAVEDKEETRSAFCRFNPQYANTEACQ